MKAGTQKKLLFVSIGILFLLDPWVTLFDPMWDAVGCGLILYGLSSLRDVCDTTEDARKNFLRLFWVSLSHIPALCAMLYIASHFITERTSILVFTFVYAVVELVLCRNAVLSLIDGLVYAGERFDGDCCFKEPGKNGKAGRDVSALRTFTTVFLVISKGLTVLPNVVYLYDTSLGYGPVMSPYVINPVEFVGPITVICFLPALAVGIVWACRMWRYLSAVRRDTVFCGKLDALIEEKRSGAPERILFRRLSVLWILLGSGAILSLDPYIDEFDVIPDVLPALFLLIAVCYMKRHFRVPSEYLLPLSILLLVSSGVLFYGLVNFNLHFLFSDVGRVEEADRAFLFILSTLTVSKILWAIVFVLILRMLLSVLRTCVGYQPLNSAGVRTGAESYLKSQKRKHTILSLIACVTALIHILLLLSFGDTERIMLSQNAYTLSTGIYMPAFEGFWMVDLLVSAVFIVSFCVQLSSMREEVKTRLYLL